MDEKNLDSTSSKTGIIVSLVLLTISFYGVQIGTFKFKFLFNLLALGSIIALYILILSYTD